MNGQSWKVVIVGPTGAAIDGSAFRLLYSFPTEEAAEKHAKCFRKTGIRYALCDEWGNISSAGVNPTIRESVPLPATLP
jgi:hypothetical protein